MIVPYDNAFDEKVEAGALALARLRHKQNTGREAPLDWRPFDNVMAGYREEARIVLLTAARIMAERKK